MASKKRFLIVIEGLDGAGLSTQAALLARYLRDKDEEVILTKEPTTSSIGNLIKAALKHEWNPSPLALQLLFAADRAHHLQNEIEPALRENKIVISDRYILSSLAFGSIDVDQEFLKRGNSTFIKPDLRYLKGKNSFVLTIKRNTKSEKVSPVLLRLSPHFHKYQVKISHSLIF